MDDLHRQDLADNDPASFIVAPCAADGVPRELQGPKLKAIRPLREEDVHTDGNQGFVLPRGGLMTSNHWISKRHSSTVYLRWRQG